MDKSLERFLRYVKIDTQSDDLSSSTPSSEKQLNLSRLLLKELEEMGIHGEIDEYGRLYAKLDGEKGYPTIGFNSHVDTALELSGKDVKPRVIENYDGGVIHLNETYSMDPEHFPRLQNRVGQTLVVTDGTTLLGADDKAGDAIIMSMLDYFISHPEVKHHPIAILFTPDEEIGRGPEHFDAKKFGADWAYTIDGDAPKNIEMENFNAAHANITISGVSIHPGEAKGKMVNAARLAGEFDALLPVNDRPEKTDGREGFNHLTHIEGEVDKATLSYILRNHDRAKLESQKEDFRKAVKALQKKYPSAQIALEIKDDYRNMKEVFDKDPRAIEHAVKVYRSLGIEPNFEPIRGGTDGATFSFLGCPTPNLGTGSYHHHGRYEFLSKEEFDQMISLCIALAKI